MKFTIHIPVLNEEKCIGRAISSILMQGVDFEIIVNDGGCTDNTMKIVEVYHSFLGDKIKFYKRPEGQHLHDAAQACLDIATGDIWHAMSAHTHFTDSALKYVEENIGSCLFGAVIHEDGTIQLPLNPESMSSYAMFLNIKFLRKNNLGYEAKYPDIADYVLRKRIWHMGLAETTDRILTMPGYKKSRFLTNNLYQRTIQHQFFKQEIKFKGDYRHLNLTHGNYCAKYDK